MVKKIGKINWMKAIVMMVIALSIAVSAVTPAYAASKSDITVSVKSPKKGVKINRNKLTIHTKDAVQLTVKGLVTKKVSEISGYNLRIKNGQLVWEPVYKHTKKSSIANVTSKARYKTSDKRVISVSKTGKLTAKKNGTATLTVKYKGISKKIKVTVANRHTWKKHIAKENWALGVVVLRCGWQGGYFYFGDNDDPYLSPGSESLIGEYTTDGYKILTSGEAYAMWDHALKDHLLASVYPEEYKKFPKKCRDVIDEVYWAKAGDTVESDHWVSRGVVKTVKYVDYYYCSCGIKKKK